MNDLTFAVWPDGTFCEWAELEQMTHRSDDYEIVEVPDDENDPYAWIEEYASKKHKHWLAVYSDHSPTLSTELYHPIF